MASHYLQRVPRRAALPQRWLLSAAYTPTRSFRSPSFPPDQSDRVAKLMPLDTFARRHIGPTSGGVEEMIAKLDPPVRSLDDLVSQVIPAQILSERKLQIAGPRRTAGIDSYIDDGFTESELTERITQIAAQNKVFRTYIGCGYAGTRVPEVIRRNVLESPAWYTSYTPYQAEISQGRLESLLNYQTMITDLTGLAIANSSLLDEPTSAAEAMTLSLNAIPQAKLKKMKRKVFFVSDLCHPQTKAVLESRAHAFDVELVFGDVLSNGSEQVRQIGDELVGVLAQYPDTEGNVEDFEQLAGVAHAQGGLFCVATDLLALTVLRPPGEFGADVAFGNAQRFGVPFGYGGPHAAFFAVTDQHKRKIPGRLVGVSKDRLGNRAIRLALQTREQHIRREKATSNICTAQVLLANMSAFYAIYHGPGGLERIAHKVIAGARIIQEGARQLGLRTSSHGDDRQVNFDTVVIHIPKNGASRLIHWALTEKQINLRKYDDTRVGITIDETVERRDLEDILAVLAQFSPIRGSQAPPQLDKLASDVNVTPLGIDIQAPLKRHSNYLTNPVFNIQRSETEVLRYIRHLEHKDLSLTHSMIPLGSCTMKLNSSTEMAPVTWPEFSGIHPFAPRDQAQGYTTMIAELEADLAEITGFDAVSLQPNSGAQGEFAALRVIRAYLAQQPGGEKRRICLIPTSAHGTNPASAIMAGMKVVQVKCDPATGDLDIADLSVKIEKHGEELGAIMVTYPSTFGVFEPKIKEVCDMVHKAGGQVYMDGANMNAQIGLCSPGEIGADACHLNLHKTFCIPHGGGGPGVGPIGVKAHLTPYLPGHPLVRDCAKDVSKAVAPISAAPWGSAGILPISWSYIKMMGARGLTNATKIALLNANYIMSRLKDHYKIVYVNSLGRCAHEFILDVRPFEATAGIQAVDVAKRLQDYGFHAPTMSWPVANTLMIEPTESESQPELDRFCDALIQIRREIGEIEEGRQPRQGNVLKMAPHSQRDLLGESWDRSYSRHTAAYPLEYLIEKKFWPSVTRLDDAYGDTNLFCSCGPGDITGAEAPTPT